MVRAAIENYFEQKVNVGKFRRNKKTAPENSRTADIYLSALSEKEKFNSGIHGINALGL